MSVATSEYGRTSLDTGGQLRDVARLVRDHWWIVLICVAVTTAVAALHAVTTPKQYQASAKLLLPEDNLASALTGTVGGGVDPTRQAATDAQLISIPAVAARVSRSLHRPLSGAAVTTADNPDTNLLTITVQDRQPATAALFANAFAAEFIGFQRDTNRARYRSALNVIQSRLASTPRNSPDAASLQSQARQLKLALSLQNGNAEVVQAATPPTSAVTPKPARDLVLGVVIGLLLGAGLAVLRDRLDRRVKSEDEIARLVPGVPTLALLPKLGRGAPSKMLVEEAYYTLETALRLVTRDRQLNSVLITSAVPGEGKSTVAANLALAIKHHGRSSLLVDADLRRPAISHKVGGRKTSGVARVLAGDGTVSEASEHLDVKASPGLDGPHLALSGTLDLVPAGPVTPHPQLLFTDSALAALLDACTQLADIVVVDGPPLGAFSDMLPLARQVSAVVLVVKLRHTRRDQLERLVSRLADTSVQAVGVVVIGTHSGAAYYADYYGDD